MSGYGRPVLLDMSAWARVLLDRLPSDSRERYGDALRAREIFTSEPFLLEALYSARDGSDYPRLVRMLGALPQAPSSASSLALALDAQKQLSRVPGVSHRVKPLDLLVAAIAHEQALGVLHYDGDYDVIAQHSGLRLDSTWIAPRGSLE